MVNKVILLGNLGKDPLVRHTESGMTVATFSIATTENYKDRDGNRQKRTEWHNLVLWNRLAEIAEEYLKKGSLIYVEGRLTSRSYETQDGSTRYITEVVVNNMQMMPRTSGVSVPLPPEDQAPQSRTSETHMPEQKSTTKPESINNNDESPDDDLPF